jgi:hypothetical protein
VLNLLSRFALIKSLFFHLFNQGSEARRSAKRECVLSIYFMIILADYFMVLSITGEKTHADQYFGSVQLDLFNTSLRFVLNLRASHSDAPYFFILVFLIFLSRFFSASLHN